MVQRFWRIWQIPNERLNEFVFSGTYQGMPFEIRPIPLNDNNSMLPFEIINAPYTPAELLTALGTCIDRNITKDDITT